MILTNIEELRLYFPSHAIDSIDPFVGVLDNSEHDFLQEKLGTPLYNALCNYYDHSYSTSVDTQSTTPFNRLLLLCQRVIAYDAMSRAIGMHIVSINNAGVNIPTADDYGKVDLEAVRTFKNTCVKEAHAAVNRLLQTLEEWTKEVAASASSTSSSSSDEPTEQETIVTLWRQSRFFYLAASMLIPSATVLQSYWNIYDSREKFIQMLPDIRYIQEEVIAPAIGEDFCDALVEVSQYATESGLLRRTIHKLRKVVAVMLEERTQVISTDKLRRQTAHDEAVRMLQSALDYIQAHQESYRTDENTEGPIYTALRLSPLYVNPEPPTEETVTEPKFKNNRSDAAMFVTPALN